MTYRSSKTWGHEVGLSVCFRQPFADSHCKELHGYALLFRVEFEATHLDRRNWVVDFGALKPLKASIVDMFDHRLVVAHDDPAMPEFLRMEAMGLCTLRIVPAVGCEAFAKLVFDMAEQWLAEQCLNARVQVLWVECREHGGNGASYHTPA